VTGKVRPPRVKGEVPEDYSGPVYHRLAEDMFAPVGKPAFRWADDKLRLERAFNTRDRLNGYRALLDGSGKLLPEWHVPLKAKILGDRPLREEYAPADPYTRLSERVYDAITSLEPSSHVFVPIDATRDDGTVERYYAMFMAGAKLGQVLHPDVNKLERIVYPDGTSDWSDPRWLSPASPDRDHFGYLDKAKIGDRHLFEGSSGVVCFSPDLFGRIAVFGDVLPKFYYFVPIGTA
jgi:hypothetical protein